MAYLPVTERHPRAAPFRLFHHGFRNSSGSLAIFAALGRVLKHSYQLQKLKAQEACPGRRRG
jgi:hypothetical protein